MPMFENTQDLARAKAAPGILDSTVELTQLCHGAAVDGGWWTDLATGKPLERNVGEMLMLMVSEISEACQGFFFAQRDDKLPQYPMLHVELADAAIRAFDFAGGHLLDLRGALMDLDALAPDDDMSFRNYLGLLRIASLNNVTPVALLGCVNAVSAAMEAHRKSRPHSVLKGRSGVEVEMANLIRHLAFLAGAHNAPLREIIEAKVRFNTAREDHKIENRRLADGKKY